MSLIRAIGSLVNGIFKPAQVQYPMPNDGDSVYEKDIDTTNSSNGDFSGSVSDYFNSLKSVNENVTADNPKIIKVCLNRTVQTASIGFGCDDLSKNFSNIVIKILGSGDSVRYTQDDSGDSTKRNSYVISFPPQTANGFIIEFHTTDTIGLSNLIIYKSQNRISRFQGVKPNGLVTDIGATENNNLRISVQEYGDTPSIDAFARLRVSENFTIFDSKQLHDKQPLFWDEEIGGAATSVHSGADAATVMTVTASAADYVIRQTKQRFNYQPGKSQLILFTFACACVAGVKKRMGYFDGTGTNNLDANNGIFFEANGITPTWVIAKNGTEVERAEQAFWNVDTMDGSGDENNPSGLLLDFDAAQIGIIDFEWLGVGRVRVGYVLSGVIRYCHYFNHANDPAFPSVYMSTPNLPMRYDIQSDGTSGSELSHICGSVMSEGGVQKTGILRAVDTGSTHVNVSSADTIYAVIGIRLKSTHIDVTVMPEAFSMISETNDDFRWSVCLNPTIAGTFTYSDLVNSSIQGAIGDAGGTNTVSDEGLVVASGYASTDTLSADQQLQTALRIGSTISGVTDELVLCVTPLSSGADIQASLTFRELL